MTPEERQKFYEEHGYVPASTRIVKKARPASQATASRFHSLLHARFMAAWRRPLHWEIPRLFENPGHMYEILGHEEFLRQITEYYSAIRDIKVEQVQRVHTKWAIQQILRTFKTHVLGFRGQSVSAKGGKIWARASGQEHHVASNTYTDILTLPETLVEDGRVVKDMDGYLRAYLVRPEDLEPAQKAALRQLEATWGVKT